MSAPATGTWQDLFPNLKPAAATARHARYGQVDVMRYHANGKVGIRYLGRFGAGRMFTASVAPEELTDVIYR